MPQFIPCLNTSTIRPAPLVDKIDLAAECGYKAIELWNDDLKAYVDKGGALKDIRKRLDDHGLSVPDIIALRGWIWSEGEEHRKALDDAKWRMEQAAAVGAPRIVATPSPGPVNVAKGAERYHELLELGKRFGVKPALEFLGFIEGLNNVKDCWAIASKAKHPDATVILDSFHMFRGGSATTDLKAIPGDKVCVFHINDAPSTPPREQQKDADRVYPGDGILDLAAMLNVLAAQGYKGPVSLELFNPAYWQQAPRQVVKTGFEKMMRFMR